MRNALDAYDRTVADNWMQADWMQDVSENDSDSDFEPAVAVERRQISSDHPQAGKNADRTASAADAYASRIKAKAREVELLERTVATRKTMIDKLS